jgi:hypothetical protein
LVGAIRGRLTRGRVLRTIDNDRRNSYDKRLQRVAGNEHG